MTSGDFHHIPVDQIKVNREGRQRRELTKIPELADDIKRDGLINPIVVGRGDLTLITGERRLEAFKLLKRETILCQYFDELDYPTRRKIELAENVKRVNLTWQEIMDAVTEYHQLKCSEDKDWTHEQTADDLGMDRGNVTHYLTVSERAETDESVRGHKLFSTARNIVQRTKEREWETIRRELLDDPITDKDIINDDFTEWVKTYKGPPFNFLHCDFPFGIGTDKMQQGHSVAEHGGYDDTEENYWRLLDVLCANIDKLCTEKAHIMFWFSMHHYDKTLKFFAEHSNFRIDQFPLVWIKTDNTGVLNDPNRGPRRIYETCLFGSRGDRKIVSAVSNAYGAPTDRSIDHMSPKPEPVLHYFFRMFIDKNSYVLDPTCGSGTALCAAESLGATHVLGHRKK